MTGPALVRCVITERPRSFWEQRSIFSCKVHACDKQEVSRLGLTAPGQPGRSVALGWAAPRCGWRALAWARVCEGWVGSARAPLVPGVVQPEGLPLAALLPEPSQQPAPVETPAPGGGLETIR